MTDTVLYAVDSTGLFLGAFVGGTLTTTDDSGNVTTQDVEPVLPDGAIAVDAPPPVSGLQHWNGTGWDDLPPPPPTPPTPREWLERLPDDKQAAITTAAIGNGTILLWLLKAAGSSSIDVTLQDTKDGIAALVAAGVLTTADEAIMLAA